MSLQDRGALDNGRGIVDDGGSNAGTAIDRYVSPTRESLAPRGAFGFTDQPYSGGGSSNVPTVQPGGGFNWWLPWSGGGVVDPGSTVNPATGQRYYPGDDPFSVLADLYLRSFGADNPQTDTTQYGVVPTQVGGSGGSSGALILLLLAAGGFGIYWFYFRKKGATT